MSFYGTQLGASAELHGVASWHFRATKDNRVLGVGANKRGVDATRFITKSNVPMRKLSRRVLFVLTTKKIVCLGGGGDKRGVDAARFKIKINVPSVNFQGCFIKFVIIYLRRDACPEKMEMRVRCRPPSSCPFLSPSHVL